MPDDTGPGRRVLLVGDAETRDAVQGDLSAAGLAVDYAPDLLDALDRLDVRQYAGILLADTERSPARAADRLRAAGHTAPVVALVEGDRPETTGVDAVAPADDPETVVTQVETVVDDYRLDRQRAERRRIRNAVQDARDAVLDADDVEAGLAALCRELVASGVYDVAWVGRRNDTSEHLDPVAAAGVPVDHLGTVSVAADADTAASVAVETGGVVADAYGDRVTLTAALGDGAEAVLHVVGERLGDVSRGERHELASLGDALGPLFDAGEATTGDESLAVLGDALGHEFGNQLDIAFTHLELAQERGDDSHFDHVESALGRMTGLVDDVRLLAGGEVDTEPVDLGEAAEAAWATVDADGATLETDPGMIEADPDLLALLLENLLRNAVDHGGPGVNVRVGPTDGLFAVADDGPGIPPEDRERVLEWGYSTDGTGVGLGIVALVADRHDWSVAVTESQSGGTRIEFS